MQHHRDDDDYDDVDDDQNRRDEPRSIRELFVPTKRIYPIRKMVTYVPGPTRRRQVCHSLRQCLMLLDRGVNPVLCEKPKNRKKPTSPNSRPDTVTRQVVSPEDAVNFFTGQKYRAPTEASHA